MQRFFSVVGIDGPPDVLEMEIAGSALAVPVYANRSLREADAGVRRLIVVIQGDRRNAAEYFDSVVDAAATADCRDAVIVAPHFRVSADLTAEERAGNSLYWSAPGWKDGSLSRPMPRESDVRASSFAVTDRLITAVVEAGRWPSLATVVIAGHSAGGQFVQRYAAGSAIEDQLAERGLAVRYFVANPSSYLYLSNERYSIPAGRFEPLTEAQLAECGGADSYKYGLRRRNAYMAASSRQELRQRYRKRSVAYALGTLDTDPQDDRLDTTCAAMYQGDSRLARGLTFHAYLAHTFGASVHRRHRLVVVPDVGHDARAMFNAPGVRKQLFGGERGLAVHA